MMDADKIIQADSASPSTSPVDLPGELPGLEQTLAPSEPLAPSGGQPHLSGVTRQRRDLAFAVVALRSGLINMRDLGNATRSWTAYGNSSLADHLVSSEVLDAAQRADVDRQAAMLVTRIVNEEQATGDEGSSISDSTWTRRDRFWMSRLDPNGKVSRMLGMGDNATLSASEMEERQISVRYTLLRKLGQGGLGVVWLARDQSLNRYVAVKEINRRVSPDDPALLHFRREAEITGRLEHPGIVPIHQYGEDSRTGNSFYVMRFLGRRTLQDAIIEYHERREAQNDDSMMLHRLLMALVSACRAVGHAHSKKIVHRDLKPENIALDEFGQVTLLDWGLAKVNDATGMYEVSGNPEPGDLHSVGSTQMGAVLGTPLYMSPEQAAGRLDEVDEISDVFGLGGILYAILTGLAPHQRTIDGDGSIGHQSDVLTKIMSGAIAPPKSVVPGTSAELSAVCMKALSPKRYLRYRSAEELANDIECCIAGKQVTAYHPTFRQRVVRRMSEHPTVTQAILLTMSLLLLGGTAITYTAHQGQVELTKSRYAAVQVFVRELDLNLDFESRGLVRNLHFVTELPLMKELVKFQQQLIPSDKTEEDGRSNADAGADAQFDPSGLRGTAGLDRVDRNGFERHGPEVWLDRQSELYDGLLLANPSYLKAVTCVTDGDEAIHEIVRTERSMALRPVRRVPRKQLTTIPSRCTTSCIKSPSELRPDEVLLVTNNLLKDHVPVKSNSPLVISGVMAVFDEDGDFFGINAIELDLRHRLEQMLVEVAPEHVAVAVTDMEGHVVMQFEDGRVTSVDHRLSILDSFPQLEGFFSPDCLVNEQGDGRTVLARRVRLGSAASKAEIGIVVHIRPNE